MTTIHIVTHGLTVWFNFWLHTKLTAAENAIPAEKPIKICDLENMSFAIPVTASAVGYGGCYLKLMAATT